ncbi:MAG: twin-arginine translocase subunit TatC [Acidobacteria bacterium]|nr:twin-arginine translocase subunit TatC [Acidobacteriota bacterium]
MTFTPPKDEQPDLTDEVETSRAPLLDHLNELRARLIKSLLALTVATIASFFFAEDIYDLLVRPFAQVAEEIRGSQLEFIFTAPMEYFFAQLKLAVFAGLFLAFPVIAWQVYAFVAPGLYKSERGAFWPYLVLAPILFALGATFVYFMMLPMLARFTVSMEHIEAAGTTIRMMPRVGDYLSLVMALMLAFGLSFQLPLVLTLLARIGVVSSSMLASGRKYAIVAILAFAAVFTPPDPMSQILLAGPVYLLYEISIFCVKLIEKRATAEQSAPSPAP